MAVAQRLRAQVSRAGLAAHHVQTRFRARVANLIAPKVEVPAPIVRSFYPQQSTCQISNLHFLFSKFFGERDHGFYVEVGAYDGILVSNTWGLSERGWSGLLIEPVPHLADLCRQNYAHREGVRVIQTAVGASDSQITLHLGDVFTTANADLHAEYGDISWASGSITAQCIEVESRTLDRILSEQGVTENFDLLVVDVEGFESEVFAGFDLTRWRPKMLIVELADTHPDVQSTARQDALLCRVLTSHGYVVTHKDWINTVFVRDDVWETAVGSP